MFWPLIIFAGFVWLILQVRPSRQIVWKQWLQGSLFVALVFRLASDVRCLYAAFASRSTKMPDDLKGIS